MSIIIFLYILGVIYSQPNTYVIIRKGETFDEIAQKLEKEGVIRNAFLFKLWATITNNTKKIKAGGYTFSKPTPMRKVLKILVKGEVSEIKVTIPEGANLKEIAHLFWEKGNVNKKEFLCVASDSEYIKTLGISAPTLEGYLFPSTYFITYATPPREIIERMVQKFFSVFNDDFKKRCKEIHWSLEDVVIFASLIEKEAVVDSEKPIISSVYHNRLRHKRPLQCDATIQYVLPEHKSKITYEDLKIDSPYNTYLYPGLPPGPICSPGESSLRAALWPYKTDYFYFVAKGDGTHIFSKDHKAHINAKRKVKALKGKI